MAIRAEPCFIYLVVLLRMIARAPPIRKVGVLVKALLADSRRLRAELASYSFARLAYSAQNNRGWAMFLAVALQEHLPIWAYTPPILNYCNRIETFKASIDGAMTSFLLGANFASYHRAHPTYIITGHLIPILTTNALIILFGGWSWAHRANTILALLAS